jgi:curved DNA-binding protein CbpA
MDGPLHDHYEILQVSPRAHPLIVAKAYRLLAALYHPDNKTTGDPHRFREVVDAYAVLSDPARRRAYDRARATGAHDDDLDAGDEDSADRPLHDDRTLRALIMQALYNTRRTTPSRPGVPLHVIAELTGCGIDDLQFTLWYLRGKKLVEAVDGSELVITVDGVDMVEADGMPDPYRALSEGQRHPDGLD